ncbi:hypothetical protein [Mycolicibacterium stellerae]|uniref:hypothetical protein n=1 Tax=Mycolicibacterium stellerae TaxID=2358193 RepID=UPI000F0B7FC1|nr:hypothetical protein [Mycolicibacterium stellerae]
MKIKSIAAVGAMGLGLGFASFIGGTGTASAECGLPTTPPAERVSCLVNADLSEFASSTNPANQLNTLFNGTDTETCVTDNTGEHCETSNDGLGLNDQLDTFKDSLADFAAGPVSAAG